MDSINPSIDLPDELDYGDDAPDAIPGKNIETLEDPIVDVIFTQSPPVCFTTLIERPFLE